MKYSNLRERLLVCAAVIASGELVAIPAFAQTTARAPASVEEVIVTARRRDENLLQVPVAITAVSGAELERRSINNAQDLQRAVPGLVAGAGSTRGSGSLVVGIRGIRNGDISAGADSSTGIYFAEAPQSAPQGINQAFFDLNSVQVLKGPQGTLFGRNSTSGAVLIEPNLPDHEFGGYVKGSLGSYNLQDYEAVLNLPAGDTLAFRLSGKYVRREGYMTNLLSGQKFSDIDRYALRAIARWTPTANFESTTIATYNDSDSTGDAFKLLAISPLASAAVAATLPANLAAGKYEFFNVYRPNGPYGTPKALDRTQSIQNKSQLALGDHGWLGDLRIKNILSYRRIESQATSNTGGTSVNTQASRFGTKIKEVSEEFQVAGKTDKLDYVAGVNYFQSKDAEAYTSFTLTGLTYRLNDSYATARSYSAFAHADYDVSSVLDGLSISLGGRVTRDVRAMTRFIRTQTTPGGNIFTCVLTGVVTADRAPCGVKFATLTFTEPTWEASANWQINPDNLVYTSWRRGYRAGGRSSLPTTKDPSFLSYNPEHLDSYEVGWKNSFSSGDLSGHFTLATYYIKYRDIQRSVATLDALGRIVSNVFNAASAHLYGGEAEFNVRFQRFSVDGGYSLGINKYDRWVDTVAVGATTVQQDISDSKFNDASKHQLNVTARYDLPVPDSFGKLTASASYYYRSHYYTMTEINTAHCSIPGAPATQIYVNCYNHNQQVPSSGVLNSRLSWEDVLGKGFDAAIFVNNVTNKLYYNGAITAQNVLGTWAMSPGAPRMWGVELRVPFGGTR